MKTIMLAMLMAISLAGQEKHKDNWQRTKECAAQAEKVAREEGPELIRSHYSPKYQRCFAYTLYYSPGLSLDYLLIDAFERAQFAEDFRSLEKGIRQCSIYDGSKAVAKDCSVVEEYIDEHLKN